MTFAVNYVGHPFTTAIQDNKILYGCLRYSAMFVAAVACDVVPGLGSAFGLVPIPTNLRLSIILLCPTAFVFTWNWER